MIKENKKLSIIVPVYNAEKYMEKCLDVGFNKESKLVKIRIRNGIIKSNFSI